MVVNPADAGLIRVSGRVWLRNIIIKDIHTSVNAWKPLGPCQVWRSLETAGIVSTLATAVGLFTKTRGSIDLRFFARRPTGEKRRFKRSWSGAEEYVHEGDKSQAEANSALHWSEPSETVRGQVQLDRSSGKVILPFTCYNERQMPLPLQAAGSAPP